MESQTSIQCITYFKYGLNAINFTHIAKAFKTTLVLMVCDQEIWFLLLSVSLSDLSEFQRDHIEPLLLYSLVQLKMQVIILNAMRLALQTTTRMCVAVNSPFFLD
jgi:hypothetical protein